MKITRKKLENIIKEELQALLSEEPQNRFSGGRNRLVPGSEDKPGQYFSRTLNRLSSVNDPHPEDVDTPEFRRRSPFSLDPTISVLDTLGDPGQDPSDHSHASLMGFDPAPLAMKGTTKAKISPKAKAKVTLDSDGNQVYDFKKGMTIKGTKPKTKAKISPKAKAKVSYDDTDGTSVYDFEKGSTITAPKPKKSKRVSIQEKILEKIIKEEAKKVFEKLGAGVEDISEQNRPTANSGAMSTIKFRQEVLRQLQYIVDKLIVDRDATVGKAPSKTNSVPEEDLFEVTAFKFGSGE